jgi:hypothetical protein
LGSRTKLSFKIWRKHKGFKWGWKYSLD